MKTTILESNQTAYDTIVCDLLSQAITGELIGMSNFASLAELIDDPHEKMEAVEHANCERNHAEGFLNLAKKFKYEPVINLQGLYWREVRECFLAYAKAKDFIGCLIIQEVMLECFAVSMYHDIGIALQNEIGDLFLSISKEEEEHIEHSIGLLQNELNKDPLSFYLKVEKIHKDCMTILGEWTASKDMKGHCGVCKGSCMKDSLHHASISLTNLRGNALHLYMDTLDRIGIPGQKSLQWIINLPA